MRHCYRLGLGSSPFARHYWGNRVYFLFLQVLRCFSSLRSLPALPDNAIACIGLPHSDIRVSQGICPSTRLFAAYHVLLRLREPRHPPYALFSLRFSFPFPAAFDRLPGGSRLLFVRKVCSIWFRLKTSKILGTSFIARFFLSEVLFALVSLVCVYVVLRSSALPPRLRGAC